MTPEEAERLVAFMPYAMIGLIAVCCVLLFLCREGAKHDERRFVAR